MSVQTLLFLWYFIPYMLYILKPEIVVYQHCIILLRHDGRTILFSNCSLENIAKDLHTLWRYLCFFLFCLFFTSGQLTLKNQLGAIWVSHSKKMVFNEAFSQC